MSDLTLCRECKSPNTPGSKFCNNCGARLPLGTNLICPNCATPNPRNRVFCDNCGTRLVKEETPKVAGKPEEPATGTKAFSLPARPPGETGELDPKTLPEWLKTGDTAAEDSALDADDQTDELPDWLKASLKAKGADLDKLPRLEELTPEKRTTDDLPDWLVSEGDTSPIIDSPKEISTEIYLDLVNRVEDTSDSDEPFNASQADLPDWLAEAASLPDIVPEAGNQTLADTSDDPNVFDSSAELGPADDVQSLAEGPGEADDQGFTDWLADSDDLAQSPPATDEADDQGFTDWLADSDDLTQLPPATDEADDQGFTDWLTDPDAFADSDEAGSDVADGLTDWLAEGEDAGNSFNELAGGAGRGLTDWLTEPEFDPDVDPTAGEAELVDWLADLDQLGETGEEEVEADESELAAFDSNSRTAEQTAAATKQPEVERPEEIPSTDGPTTARPSEPELITPSATPAEPTDDWLAIDSFSQEDPLVEEELPDWLEQLGPRVSSQPPDSNEVATGHELPPLPSEDLPDWIASLRPNSSLLGSSLPGALSPTSPLPEPLEDIPEELAGAELPEWLQDIPISESSAPAEEGSAIPDWLISDGDLAERYEHGDVAGSQGWDNLLDDLPTAVPLEQTLVRADIPDWLQALKPSGLLDQPSLPGEREETEQAAPTSGPLAGIPGVVAIEPVILKPHTTSAFDPLAATLSPTAAQQQQAALLRQLVRSDPQSAIATMPETARVLSPPAVSLWLRLLLAGILIATILLGLLAPDWVTGMTILPIAPAPAGVEQVYTVVEAAAGRPVLVAFDYTPALAGELTPHANLLLAQLQGNGSPVLTVSQYAAGTAVAAASSQDLSHQDLGYLPGEAIGLRQLGNCFSHQLTCATIPGWGESVAIQPALADVALVIVLTGERNSLVNWVEQVGSSSQVPIVAAVTQALAPVAAPYLATGQLEAVLAGTAAATIYEEEFGPELASSGRDGLATPLAVQSLAQLVIATLLLLGGLFYTITGTSSRQSVRPT